MGLFRSNGDEEFDIVKDQKKRRRNFWIFAIAGVLIILNLILYFLTYGGV